MKELEISFLPRYQDIVYNIPVQKADVYRNSQELTTAINKRGDDWHKEINTIIGRKKSEIMEIEKKNAWPSFRNRNMKSQISFLKLHVALLIWMGYLSRAISPLPWHTHQRMIVSEIFFQNSKSYIQASLLKKSTKSNFLNSLGRCQ